MSMTTADDLHLQRSCITIMAAGHTTPPKHTKAVQNPTNTRRKPPAAAMADTRIRVGVMGQGRSGFNIHVRCMSDVETVKERFVVVAIADAIPERRDQAEKELGCAVFDDWRKMLDAGGFDMVINSLPSPLHVDATIQAFAQGYHVLSEKPLAKKVRRPSRAFRALAVAQPPRRCSQVADVDRILAAEETSGKIFFPFQQVSFAASLFLIFVGALIFGQLLLQNRLQPFFYQMQVRFDANARQPYNTCIVTHSQFEQRAAAGGHCIGRPCELANAS
jgi:hypothetical protein